MIEPVIETFGAVDFRAWPVEDRPGHAPLPLSGQLGSSGVGTAMAVIAKYNRLDTDADAVQILHQIVDADWLIAPGGLRVRDTSAGSEVGPSCCCGLEDWREWQNVAEGQTPWLGHGPTPWLQYLERSVRVWPDGGEAQIPPVGQTPIEIINTDLPGLIDTAHRHLQDFLKVVEAWATGLDASRTDELVSALDRNFQIGEPLIFPR